MYQRAIPDLRKMTEITLDEFLQQMRARNLRWLCDNAEVLDEPFDDGYTPLQHAVIEGCFEFASNLVGSAGYQHPETGMTALMLAAQTNDAQIAPLLLKKEACMQDFQRKTALMHAVLSHSSNLIELLADYEANMTDIRGYNAALMADDADVRAFLLQYEAWRLTHEEVLETFE